MPTLISGSTGVNKITDGTIVNADIASGAAIAGSKLVMPAGSVLQMTESSGITNLSSTSASFIDTPVLITITPTSTSSKICVNMMVFVWPVAAQYMYFRVTFREVSTNTNIITYGDTYTADAISFHIGVLFTHSPNTTSAVTYTLQARGSNSGTWYCPNSNGNSDITKKYSSTAMEIAV